MILQDDRLIRTEEIMNMSALDILKMGMMIGFLKQLRDRMRADGRVCVADSIAKFLDDLGV